MTEKCKDRIAGQLQGRLESMGSYEGCDCDDYDCTCEDDHNDDMLTGENVLSVDRILTYKIHLSTGGPGDWFMVEINEGEIVSIEYHFHDWFDHAERQVTGDAFDTVENWILSQLYIEEIM